MMTSLHTNHDRPASANLGASDRHTDHDTEQPEDRYFGVGTDREDTSHTIHRYG
jgi:hypothetical protein